MPAPRGLPPGGRGGGGAPAYGHLAYGRGSPYGGYAAPYAQVPTGPSDTYVRVIQVQATEL